MTPRIDPQEERVVSALKRLQLTHLRDTLAAATTIVLSVPAYWGGPSGVVKNCLDLLGGAAYDLDEEHRQNPFTGKLVGLLVVGADDLSAQHGLSSMRLSLGALGAWVAPRAVTISNPRRLRNMGAVLQQLSDLGAYLWEHSERIGPALAVRSPEPRAEAPKTPRTRGSNARGSGGGEPLRLVRTPGAGEVSR